MTDQQLIRKAHDPTPLYHRLKDLLRHEIKQDFTPHQRFHSVRELVDRHGVSNITVTRALRDLVEEGCLYTAQGKGTFVSPAEAMPLTSEGPLTISLPMQDSYGELLFADNPMHMQYMKGLMAQARHHGVVVEYQFVTPEQTADFFYGLMERNRPYGYVFYGSRQPFYLPLIRKAIERRVPYVAFQPERALTWEVIDQLGINYVTSDQQSGIMQATAHLIAMGHRRIAFWRHRRAAYTRESGYRLAMAQAALPVDESMIESDFNLSEPCLPMLRRLIAQGATALVAASDLIAIQAMEEARAAKLRIPDQLSLVGYDDIEKAVACMPPLTTVRVDRDRVGRLVTSSLIQQYEALRRGLPTARVAMLDPVELVVRQSVKPMRR